MYQSFQLVVLSAILNYRFVKMKVISYIHNNKYDKLPRNVLSGAPKNRSPYLLAVAIKSNGSVVIGSDGSNI